MQELQLAHCIWLLNQCSEVVTTMQDPEWALHVSMHASAVLQGVVCPLLQNNLDSL